MDVPDGMNLRSIAAVARMTIPPAYCFTFGANEHAANRVALNSRLPATI
jgi:hypothetical protein